MACWRVLDLADYGGAERIPQLLIKPCFDAETYKIFLTDLSNIWSEELDLAGIVHRASEEESPIEVGTQDSAQLAILLENVRKSLTTHDDTTCHITRNDSDGIVLHTTISLPEPLDSLSWRFCLRKRTAATLKNELILPLLVSSHIQHERINNLISNISEKDRAITRLVDQYESSNLDLAAAFPSIGGLKSGRRLVKREQAAKHIPGLLVFNEDSWKKETAELDDTNVSTLGLFQEALTECAPEVPQQLKSENESNAWWESISTKVEDFTPAPRTRSQPQGKKAELPPKAAASESETDEDETEDEFETHENFKLREVGKPSATALRQNLASAEPTSPRRREGSTDEDGENDDDDEDEDLDAPPKSQTQFRVHEKKPALEKVRTPEPSPSNAISPMKSPSTKAEAQPAQKPKGNGFRIGGKAKRTESPVPSSAENDCHPSEEIPMRSRTSTETAASNNKPAKRGFKIGGKAKVITEDGASNQSMAPTRRSGVDMTPTETLPAKRSIPAPKADLESTPMEEEREETAEEKAERKRRELKRKNEEQAKKQAQNKKKKRF